MSRRSRKRTATAVLDRPMADDDARSALYQRVHGSPCGYCSARTVNPPSVSLPGPTGRMARWSVCDTCALDPTAAGRRAAARLLAVDEAEPFLAYLDVPPFAARWGSDRATPGTPWSHLTLEGLAPLALAAESRRARLSVPSGCGLCSISSHPSGRADLGGRTLCAMCGRYLSERTWPHVVDAAAMFCAGYGVGVYLPGAADRLGFVPWENADDETRARWPNGCLSPFGWLDLAALHARALRLTEGPGWAKRPTGTWPTWPAWAPA